MWLNNPILLLLKTFSDVNFSLAKVVKRKKGANMRLLQFEPSQLPAPSPHHASTLGPTRIRVRAALSSKNAPVPTSPQEINLVAQPLAGEQLVGGGQQAGHVALLVGGSKTAHSGSRLARPR